MAWKLKKRLRFFIFLIVVNVSRLWKWLKKKLWFKKKPPGRTFTEEEDEVKLVTPRSGDFKKSGDAILNNIDELIQKGGLTIPSNILNKNKKVLVPCAPVIEAQQTPEVEIRINENNEVNKT